MSDERLHRGVMSMPEPVSDERLAQIEARADGLPAGPWEMGWDGQQFYLRDGEGIEIMELTFAIPTWGERYEQAKATCDIAVPEFLFHARDDVPALITEIRRLRALTTE
jgi:hypothetical protein